jgi:tetratricopeptide (TPR) repeat protein
MSNAKPKPAKADESAAAGSGPELKAAKGAKAAPTKGAPVPPAGSPPPPPPLFRRTDWLTFGVTTVLTLAGYLLTIAPDLTLEDCGELAVGSYYAGVPHAPGYPVWTVYSWLFTVLLPFSNVAWRVAVSSAVAAALANGLLALVVSRGSSMILEGIEELRQIDRRVENALCIVAGFVAGVTVGYNGFMWSQAVIVEVYTLSVLSLMGVLCCMLRWLYAPEQRRYLYLAWFLFGISFNNHQTLIVAAMGLEVLIVAAQPKLGRDVLLGNVIVYLCGLVAKEMGILTTFDANPPLYVIYNLVGLGSMAAVVWLTMRTNQWLPREWKAVLLILGAWLLGAAFYFYMPVTGATNPPMNWGYPRTFDGFVHAFTRGQYERTNPTNILADPLRFVLQLRMYFEGAVEEFHCSPLLLVVVPFLFLRRMQRREQAWLLGNTAIYFCLAFLLLILLNPATDRQSRDLTKVFFTASHVILAMFLGYGLTLIGALLLTHYERFRPYALYGGAVGTAFALYYLVARIGDVYGNGKAGLLNPGVWLHGLREVVTKPFFTPPVYSIYAAIFVLLLALFFVALILVHRTHIKPGLILAAFGLLPLYPLMSHWAENEQRGHLFGFWFGHDMFTPPFGIYPEMTRDAILFGGTDPGRFCPTYMIFCESFIKPQHRRDPKFDRRDVYIITQNALADGTYLNYIRAHYNRSAQQDPPFLRDIVLFLQNIALGREEARKKFEALPYRASGLARIIGGFTNLVAPFDRLITNFGQAVEDRRRRQGVYPPDEIATPTIADSQKAFQDYIVDAQRRLLHDSQFPNEPRQIRPGEQVSFTPDGRVSVAGQVAVMAINGLLTKVIFDKNPNHEFFVEESFPLEWMYPYLTPFGIIMKINREPVPEMTEEILRRDHAFWTKFAERLCGDWISYDTPIQEICQFVERVYRRGDLTGYKGDPKFVRDNDAQKAFSKLRNSIAGMYAWRINESKNPAERSRLIREADFAFKQAFAFCPYSPETVTRYVTMLATLPGRLDDALLLAETCRKFDEESLFTASLIDQLQRMQQGMATVAQMQTQISQFEQQYRTNPYNVQAAFNLASAYLQLQRTNEAFQILDQLIVRSNADANTLLSVANAYVGLGQYRRVEPALRRLTVLAPESPEVWYDLAGAQAILGLTNEAIRSLERSLMLSNLRLVINPTASNLQAMAANDGRFATLRALPEFQKAVGPK